MSGQWDGQRLRARTPVVVPGLLVAILLGFASIGGPDERGDERDIGRSRGGLAVDVRAASAVAAAAAALAAPRARGGAGGAAGANPAPGGASVALLSIVGTRAARAPGTSTRTLGSGDGGIPAEPGERSSNKDAAPRATLYGGGGAVPADVPDAHDDDIVARQLREAATKESDPELRAKLWDEYRRYKNSR